MNKLDELIGSVEAAAILDRSRVTFNRWAATGKVPIAIQTAGITGIRLFNRSDIEQLAADLKSAKTANIHRHRSGPQRKAKPGPDDVPLVGLDVGDGGDKRKPIAS